jgi:hypothetical protein
MHWLGQAEMPMRCQDLAARIEQLQPQAQPRDVARLCLLLANQVGDIAHLQDDQVLTDAWRDVAFRLQAAADQHAAMTEELEALASRDPHELAPDQVCTLLRAIKVQNQVLQLYVGSGCAEVEEEPLS